MEKDPAPVAFADCLPAGRAHNPPLNPMENVHRETVFFSGHVQGVGFRYAVLQIAREFDVAGYVRNLADERVELAAEGQAEEVGKFVAEVEERMSGYIRKVERSAQIASQKFSGFAIR